MSTTAQIDHVATGRPAILSMIGALAFVGFYLAMDFVHGAVATGSRPLPNDPDNVIYRYLVNDSAAVAAGAAMMLVSVSGLALFLVATRRALPALPNPWGYRFGVLAVAAMSVSIALSMMLAGTASSMSVNTAVWLNQAGFIAGGVAHVVCLGLYVGVTGRQLAARGPRVLAMVAAVPALLSVVSLVWFYGSALILLGRLLCMAWTLTVGVALVRAARHERVVLR